jgi:hypothetical protein
MSTDETKQVARLRREFIVCLVRHGHTYESIGNRWGISRARVYQLASLQRRIEARELEAAGLQLETVETLLRLRRRRLENLLRPAAGLPVKTQGVSVGQTAS